MPTYEESDLLRSKTKKQWYPPLDDVKDLSAWPFVIKHGDFFFAMLVCSELLDIRYRDHLRGKIDCLFVPEWNRDVDLFNDLINASANDLHAFIVQCNNNKYGDSRIRAPYKLPYKRDVVKVKGGINDYYVVGTIEYGKLRLFQDNLVPDRSDSALFKPFPSGFHISDERLQSLKKEVMVKTDEKK
jgi:hypothetical protein